MMGNRLAEAFIEIAIRDMTSRGFAAQKTALKSHLDSMDSVVISHQRRRDQAALAEAERMQSVLKPLPGFGRPRAMQEDLAAMRTHTTQQQALMDRRSAHEAIVASRGEENTKSQKEADLEAMRVSRRRFEAQQQQDADRKVAMDRWIAAGRPRVDPSNFDARAREGAQHAQAAALARQNKFNQALLQASFGAQDFAVMYGPMGLQGALRASVNNWAQVAAIIDPLKGAFVGLGLTIATVAVPAIMEWMGQADGAATKTDRLTASLNALQDRAKFEVDLFRADMTSGIDSVRGGTDRLNRNDMEIAESKKEIDAQQKRLDELKGLRDRPRLVGAGKVDMTDDEDLFTRVRQEIETISNTDIWNLKGVSDVLSKGGGKFADGLVVSLNRKTGELIVAKERPEEERKKLTEEIESVEGKIREAAAASAVKERERVKIREQLKEVGEKELETIKRGLGATDELGRKLVQIEENRRKDQKAAALAADAAGTGPLERAKVKAGIDAQADKMRRDAIKENDKRTTEEAGRQFGARRQLIAGMRDDIAPAFAPVGQILDRLHERKREIAELENLSAEKKNALMGMADKAARSQLDELAKKRTPASFAGVAEMGQRVQLSMMSNPAEDNIRKTANYAKLTVAELTKINANLRPAGYAD